MLAEIDPEMVAEGLNELAKALGQESNLTPEQVRVADFYFDGEYLEVAPPIPTLDATQMGELIRRNSAPYAQENRPPITPEQLREIMEDFADEGTHAMIEDHGHGTMLFPFLYGGPLAIIGLPDINLNDPLEGRYHAARIRVESLPAALEGFILIAQAWVVATLLEGAHSVGRVSEHPDRRQALLVAGAHANGWRYTICVVFDNNWRVIGRITSEDPQVLMTSEGMVQTLAGAVFETDTEKLRRFITAYEARRKGKGQG